MMTSGVAWVLHRAGFYSPVMAVSRRSRFSSFCSLLISSGIAEKITLSVAWVLHRAGSLTLQRRAVPAVQLREALQVPDLIRKACDDDVRM